MNLWLRHTPDVWSMVSLIAVEDDHWNVFFNGEEIGVIWKKYTRQSWHECNADDNVCELETWSKLNKSGLVKSGLFISA